MNIQKINRSLNYLAYFLLAWVFIVSFSVSYTSLIQTYPELALGVTIDLTLVAPLIYLFLIWKTKIPKTTVVPFFVVTTIVASFLIPDEQQFYLGQIQKWLIPMAELGVLSFITFSVYKTVKAYKSVSDKNADILYVLEEVANKLISSKVIAKLMAFELAVIYYAFISWRKPALKQKAFTYHKQSGKVPVFGMIVFIIFAETLVLHYLVGLWSPILAWIFTLSSLYVMLQMFAHMKAVYQRPIEIIGDKLYVRYGLFSGAEIQLANIENVEFSTIKPNDFSDVKQVALLGEIEQFNTQIQLKSEASFLGFYGKKDTFKTLLLFVDDTERFANSLKLDDPN